MKTRYADATAYTTKDGSQIHELMHPTLHGDSHGSRAQSLAEATVPAGTTTHLHRHRSSEELYYIVAGQGSLTLGAAQFRVEPGDTVLIPPGTPHCVSADAAADLRILCCCSPAYSHDDTEVL